MDDTLHVSLPSQPATSTKRSIVANLAKVYDPLGLVSPAILEGKQNYREASEMKLIWDIPIPEGIAKRWLRWKKNAPNDVYFPRSLVQYHKPIDNIKLHAFGDASNHGVCAVVHAVVTQASGVTQGLITAKSCLAEKYLTIPRLELVSGHMAVDLSTNVGAALEGFNMTEDIQCWLDSTVALHWLNDDGEYRQLVANRVKKIQSHPDTQWRHVPASGNPVDLGSRCGNVNEAELWWNGPPWLFDPSQWLANIVTMATDDSDAGRKVQRELFALGVETNHDFDTVLKKFGLRKAMRICA